MSDELSRRASTLDRLSWAKDTEIEVLQRRVQTLEADLAAETHDKMRLAESRERLRWTIQAVNDSELDVRVFDQMFGLLWPADMEPWGSR